MNRSTSYLPLLKQVRSIAVRAGIATLKHYKKATLKTYQKHDQSPLTEADLESHKIIEKGLLKIDSKIPIISEEADLPSIKKRLKWNTFWLVDPLDGTKEFIKQNGEFTINIALIKNRTPVLGVVYAPTKQITYYGALGVGSKIKRADQYPKKITSSLHRGKKYRVVVSRSHPSEKLSEYLKQFDSVQTILVGSSLKLCYVADGSADVYPRFGPTMEWDVAAGDAVFRYATQKHHRANASPLIYNKQNLKNGSFILSSIPKNELPAFTHDE